MVERQFVALKVVGSSPIIYPLKNYFLLKKIKRKSFKKKNNLTTLNIRYIGGVAQNVKPNMINIRCYKEYLRVYTIQEINKNKDLVKNSTISLSQKRFNNKATISSVKTLNTFSVGSIIKYFKVKQGCIFDEVPRV